jgi:hypothetical protein
MIVQMPTDECNISNSLCPANTPRDLEDDWVLEFIILAFPNTSVIAHEQEYIESNTGVDI